MKLDEFRVLFLTVTLGLALVAASPLLVLSMSFQNNSEQFSEFWLLGPEHLAGNYPSTVNSNEIYTIYVDLVNHLGRSELYMVQMKVRNIEQAFLEVATSEPSSSDSLYDFRVSLVDESAWELPVTFGFQDIFIDSDVATVSDVVVNGFVLPLDISIPLNVETSNFVFQLFFELWRYDVNSQQFVYDNQFVGLWLNLTL